MVWSHQITLPIGNIIKIDTFLASTQRLQTIALKTNQIFKVASTKRQRPFTNFLNLIFRFVIAWSTNREDIIGNNICKFQPTKIVVGKPKGWKCILGLQERDNIFCMKIYDKKGQKLKFCAFTIFCFFPYIWEAIKPLWHRNPFTENNKNLNLSWNFRRAW